jgi:phytoene dehydrogenase-like protein
VFAGMGAHSILPLEAKLTASFALMLGASAHTLGWTFPKGGAQKLSDAMASYFESLGGKIEFGNRIGSFDHVPKAKAVLFDTTPRQLVEIAGARLPSGYRRRLEKFRYGPGVFKLDLALDGPIPWANPEVGRCATVHVGGTLEDIAASERAPWMGKHAERPFLILAQHTLFDETRAPEGKHTVWAYCHVPSGSEVDMTDAIESQIERFAPGFKDLIIGRHTFNTIEMHAKNANYIGGDIAGGSHGGLQALARPTLSYDPYKTPAEGIYLCSASTPPGGGVHGMCGLHAANSALRYLRRA